MKKVRRWIAAGGRSAFLGGPWFGVAPDFEKG
jgi:hypothetical protein